MRGIRPYAKRRPAGFTLLELLVSLALLALIAVFIAGSFRFGRRAWETAEEVDYIAHVSAARRFIEHKLADTRAINQVQPNGRVQLAFEGQPHRLAFVAVSQGYTEVGGLYQYELRLDNGSDGAQALYVTQALYRPNGPVAETAQKRLLIDRVENVEMRYFGTTAGGWAPTWSNTSKLPQLVSIKIEFPKGDPRRWPEQVVRIMAAQTLPYR